MDDLATTMRRKRAEDRARHAAIIEKHGALSFKVSGPHPMPPPDDDVRCYLIESVLPCCGRTLMSRCEVPAAIPLECDADQQDAHREAIELAYLNGCPHGMETR